MQECEVDSRKWGTRMRGSAGSGMGQLDVAYECEILSRMWGRPVMVSAGSLTGL